MFCFFLSLISGPCTRRRTVGVRPDVYRVRSIVVPAPYYGLLYWGRDPPIELTNLPSRHGETIRLLHKPVVSQLIDTSLGDEGLCVGQGMGDGTRR